MKLDGFGIAGYRSFGQDMVFIKDLGKVNIFIGKNNSGKSNILRFCKHLSEIKIDQPYKGFNEQLDHCIDSNDKGIQFALQIKRNSPATGKIYNEVSDILPQMIDIFPQRYVIFYS